MDEVWNKFSYQSGSTNAGTTAEEAFAQRQGVCQDYAQILLSILREEGITARYVAGAVPGEGETHAWVEVWCDGKWYFLGACEPEEVLDTDFSSMTAHRADCGAVLIEYSHIEDALEPEGELREWENIDALSTMCLDTPLPAELPPAAARRIYWRLTATNWCTA